MADRQGIERASSLYRQHNKPNRRCGCTRCQEFRKSFPRTAATEDGTVHIVERVKQYKEGDLS